MLARGDGSCVWLTFRWLLGRQFLGLVGDDGPELNDNLDLGDGIVTSPDALNRAKKVAVHLDGMSTALHGNPKIQQTDAMINRILKMEASAFPRTLSVQSAVAG